jgi:hypothetical protein
MNISRISAGIAVGVAVLLGANTALAASGWTIVAAPGQPGILSSVTSTSDTNAWAVGYTSASGTTVPLIDQWNGAEWSQVTAPSTGGSLTELSAVSASSTTDAWAVGYTVPSLHAVAPVAMHWNGTAWSISSGFALSSLPIVADRQDSLPIGVVDINSDDAYAIASSYWPTPLAAQWNGTTWTPLSLPVPTGTETSSLSAISADGPDDVWIAGSFYISATATTEQEMLHWNGSAWSFVPLALPSTAPTAFSINSIEAISPTNVWAVGGVSTSLTLDSTTLVEHWNGTAWSIVPSPSPGVAASLSGVTASSPTDVWAVGDYAPNGSSVLTLTMQWNGTAWGTVSSPNASTGVSALNSVATTPGAAIVQAVGYSDYNLVNTPLAMQNG